MKTENMNKRAFPTYIYRPKLEFVRRETNTAIRYTKLIETKGLSIIEAIAYCVPIPNLPGTARMGVRLAATLVRNMSDYLELSLNSVDPCIVLVSSAFILRQDIMPLVELSKRQYPVYLMPHPNCFHAEFKLPTCIEHDTGIEWFKAGKTADALSTGIHVIALGDNNLYLLKPDKKAQVVIHKEEKEEEEEEEEEEEKKQQSRPRNSKTIFATFTGCFKCNKKKEEDEQSHLPPSALRRRRPPLS